VKFIFPNNFNIYLHDTPGDRLFFREKRTFSHGCIRIENPTSVTGPHGSSRTAAYASPTTRTALIRSTQRCTEINDPA